MMLLVASDFSALQSTTRVSLIPSHKRISLHLWFPVKPKEAESLREAVRLENRRLRAYEAQRRLVRPFDTVGAI
jgi:hypothetical protein